MTDATLQAEITAIENELLNIIIQNLKDQRINDEQAKQWAKEFLSLLPIQDKKDLLTKLKAYSKTHPDTNSIYLKYAVPYEEEERQKKLTLMSEHIQNGQIEQALSVAKGEPANG